MNGKYRLFASSRDFNRLCRDEVENVYVDSSALPRHCGEILNRHLVRVVTSCKPNRRAKQNKNKAKKEIRREIPSHPQRKSPALLRLPSNAEEARGIKGDLEHPLSHCE